MFGVAEIDADMPPPSGGGGGQFELTRHSDPPLKSDGDNSHLLPSPPLLLSFLFFPRSTMEEAKASNTCRGRRRDGCGLSYMHPGHGLRCMFGLPATVVTHEFTPGDRTILSPTAVAGDLLANSQCTSMDERAEARMERTGAAEGKKERRREKSRSGML